MIQAQRDLASDEDAEVQAMANYTHAKIAFDMAMGRTLDVNRISMQEAVDGHVGRESIIPESLPVSYTHLTAATMQSISLRSSNSW